MCENGQSNFFPYPVCCWLKHCTYEEWIINFLIVQEIMAAWANRVAIVQRTSRIFPLSPQLFHLTLANSLINFITIGVINTIHNFFLISTYLLIISFCQSLLSHTMLIYKVVVATIMLKARENGNKKKKYVGGRLKNYFANKRILGFLKSKNHVS